MIKLFLAAVKSMKTEKAMLQWSYAISIELNMSQYFSVKEDDFLNTVKFI